MRYFDVAGHVAFVTGAVPGWVGRWPKWLRVARWWLDEQISAQDTIGHENRLPANTKHL